MLFSLLTISQLISASWACEDIIAVENVFPASGALEVAQDVVLRVTMDGGMLLDTPQFVLRSGDEEIEIDVSIATRESSDRSQYAYIEIAPLDLLSADHQFALSVVEEDGKLSTLSIFQTTEGLAVLPEESPYLNYVSKYEVWSPEECDLNQDEVYFYFDSAEDQIINIYTVSPEVRYGMLIDESELQTPFFTIFPEATYDDFYAYIPVQDFGVDMCFVYAFASESGVEGPMSEVFCISDSMSYDDFKCGTGAFWGCSSTAPTTFGWMGMVLAMLGLKRRRQ